MAPTLSVAEMSVVCAACTMTSVNTSAWKPVFFTVSRYFPRERFTKVCVPFSCVSAFRKSFVATSRSSSWAPCTTLPLGSTMLTVTVPSEPFCGQLPGTAPSASTISRIVRTPPNTLREDTGNIFVLPTAPKRLLRDLVRRTAQSRPENVTPIIQRRSPLNRISLTRGSNVASVYPWLDFVYFMRSVCQPYYCSDRTDEQTRFSSARWSIPQPCDARGRDGFSKKD